MYNNFVRLMAAAPDLRVADCAHNADQIVHTAETAAEQGAAVLCLPELCVTAYTCGELFLQDTLLRSAREALTDITKRTASLEILLTAGLPLAIGGRLYNVTAVLCKGEILGFVPKTRLPAYGEFYEPRHFTPAPPSVTEIDFGGRKIPFGARLLFRNGLQPEMTIGIEMCEDLWQPFPPSDERCLAGALIILNPSAGDETIGKAAYRRDLAKMQSAKGLCAYVYAGAGRGESSTDMVFSGHSIICENGVILAESLPFSFETSATEIDLSALARDRRYMNSFKSTEIPEHRVVEFSLETSLNTLTRPIDPHPFVPKDVSDRDTRCEEILNIQSHGLATRLKHTGAGAIIGVSGGLDSTLALLVTVRAFELLNRSLDGLFAVTMPCFGTTERTRNNANLLCESLGVHCKTINISEEASLHLRSVGERGEGVVFENVQARLRTNILMNLANRHGALVVGTGDLSELALGWATYNGDHMSMYAVNVGVPKTLVRHIVKYCADTADKTTAGVLNDVLATPVSPELLPPINGEIRQKTEEIVGPYELHDFFLYHTIRRGRTPREIFGLANIAFKESYTHGEILKWLKVFIRRFFSQQFKRSCLPDGPKVGSVTLSPRGDWRMPSDASPAAWLADLEGC